MSSDPLIRLGRRVAEQQAGLLEAEALEAGQQEAAQSEAARRRVVEHVLARSGRGPRAQVRRGPARYWLAAAAGVGLTLLGLWLGTRLEPAEAALAFTVGSDRRGVLQALEAAPAAAPLPIRFSDGSLLDLAPSAQARVVATGPDGAEVVLEAGRARVDVVPRSEGRRAHWQIRSGPFSVHVKGTSFGLSWDPGHEAFSLDLFEGEVLITGCGLGNGRQLRAGERLEASCRPPLHAAPAPASSAPAAHTEQVAPSQVEAPASPTPRARPARAHTRWLELARQGKFQAAYALVEERWAEQLGAARAEELLLLGQAARVTRHAAEAEQAYRAVRSRFAGSPAAARAAFSLGLLAFERDPARASEWLETYLSEEPRGPLSEPALERLLEAALRSGDRPRQKDAARRYLERAATGPHAAEARRILAGAQGE